MGSQLDPFDQPDDARDLLPTEPIEPADEPLYSGRFDATQPNRSQVSSRNPYLNALALIAEEDVRGLLRAEAFYGDSWKRRGGVGAFMMLARKWDRLENAMTAPAVECSERQHGDGTTHPERRAIDRYDIFKRTLADGRAEGLIDDIRDLRRYLLLVEGELRARGLDLKHRDNS